MTVGGDDEMAVWQPSELVGNGDAFEEDEDWIPDREKARRLREGRPNRLAKAEPNDFFSTTSVGPPNGGGQSGPGEAGAAQPSASRGGVDKKSGKRKSYTAEEEELIAAMGGKSSDEKGSKREPGFIGDSTLREIAMDYSVPVCYLADVLVMWGVPVPIDVNGLLGDMVTGEQAFAIVEALHTLDVAELHDRYSNYDMATLCDEYEIDIRDAFELAMKEGWSLPFGVRTFLRVEQEDQLLRLLG